jgi:hypothetical protein
VAPLILASTLGALLIPALPFVVPSSEASLARIWGLGARRAGKFTVVASVVGPLQSSTDDGADRHGQTSILAGYRSGAKGRWIERSQARRHWVVSLVVGILIAVLIGVGAFLLLVSQQ